MTWLLTFLAGLAEKIFVWFLGRATQRIATFLAYSTFIIGLFVAFVLLVKTTLFAIVPLAPNGLAFGLGMLPPVIETYIEIYLTALTAKRVYDWKKTLAKDYFVSNKGMLY